MESPKQDKQEERLGQSPSLMDSLSGNHEPVSTLYQYVPTEPIVLSPHVEIVDVKHIAANAVPWGQALGKEIDDLRQYKTLSEERFEKMGRLIADQNKLMEFLMAKLK